MSWTRFKLPVTRSGERPDVVFNEKILILRGVYLADDLAKPTEACLQILQMGQLQSL